MTKLFISLGFRHDFSLTCGKVRHVDTEGDAPSSQALAHSTRKLLKKSEEKKKRNSLASGRRKQANADLVN